jgi:hypothetical protein
VGAGYELRIQKDGRRGCSDVFQGIVPIPLKDQKKSTTGSQAEIRIEYKSCRRTIQFGLKLVNIFHGVMTHKGKPKWGAGCNTNATMNVTGGIPTWNRTAACSVGAVA